MFPSLPPFPPFFLPYVFSEVRLTLLHYYNNYIISPLPASGLDSRVDTQQIHSWVQCDSCLTGSLLEIQWEQGRKMIFLVSQGRLRRGGDIRPKM